VVKHLTRNLKIKGSDHASGTEREKLMREKRQMKRKVLKKMKFFEENEFLFSNPRQTI
jgi:hypothetical protein